MTEETVRILVVEDDRVSSHQLSSMLEAKGYDVLGVVAGGREALERVRTDEPDLVFMDISLPGIPTRRRWTGPGRWSPTAIC